MGFPRLHSVLRLERVGKIYPTGEVLRDVTWEVKAGDRIGLVGVNGAGKSTQLRLIAGMEEASSGQIVKQGEPRIAYLQQEFDVDPNRTVREELFQAFGEAAIVLGKLPAWGRAGAPWPRNVIQCGAWYGQSHGRART